MAVIPIRRTTRLDGPIPPEALPGVLYQTEDAAHQFVISCTQGGEPVALSGTVSGKFVRSEDNATVPLTGTISDGAAHVTLNSSCYLYTGRFTLSIFVSKDGAVTCVYSCTGSVRRTEGEETVDPSGEITLDVATLVSQIEDAVASIPADYSDLLGTIAGTYSNESTYAVGDYAWYDGALYRCVSAITTAESWTAAHWTAVVLGDDIANINSEINRDEDITADFVSGGFYALNGGVGSTAPEDTTEFDSYSSLMIPCNKGDILTITCSGGDRGRAWAITDTDRKILSVADANASVSGMTLQAEEDGYFYVNNSDSTQPNKSAVFSYSLIGKINELDNGVQQLKNAITMEVSVLDRFETGKYYKLNGGVGTTVPESPTDFASYSTLKMKCYAGDTLTITCSGGGSGRAWAITDSNNVILSVASADASVSNKVLTATVNGYFYVNNADTLQANKTAVLGTTVGNYEKTIDADVDNVEDRINAIENSIGTRTLKGKKWNVMGDSITANPDYAPQGGRYFELISARQNGMTTRNYGIGGSKIGGSDSDAFCNRYESMNSDADIVTVYGGVNDYQHPTDPTPLGQYGDSTNETFYGALKILLEGLITRYPYALIVFMTPIQPIRDNRPTEANALGFTIDDYADAMIKMCGRYGVPVVDLCHMCGFTSRIEAEKTYYFYDGLHLNKNGHNKISYLLEDAMNKNAKGKIIDTVA